MKFRPFNALSPAKFPKTLFIMSLAGAMSCATAAQDSSMAGEAPQKRGAGAVPSDPVVAGWMLGAPPSKDKLITLANGGFGYPKSRWSFSNMRRLMPTSDVWRGEGPVSVLPQADKAALALDGVSFVDMRGGSHRFSDLMRLTDADGIVILHKGKIVYEKYAGALNRETPHAAMSVTKSILGTVAEMLIDEGRLDGEALVTRYVPELQGTGFDGATVRELLDMTTAIAYSEKYADPSAQIWGYFLAVGAAPRPAGYAGPANLYDFLGTMKRDGEHGAAFGYKTVNAEALGWVLQRATGKSLSALVSQMIWRPMGAEEDAYFDLDSRGTECAGGGFNATLRDLARFGEVMRNNGRFNGKQIVPERVVAKIRRGGDRQKFAQAGYKTLPGWSYTGMWWVSNDEHGVFEARGIFGQAIYVDPKAEMTVVRLASGQQAANEANDWITLPAFRAVADALMSTSDANGASGRAL